MIKDPDSNRICGGQKIRKQILKGVSGSTTEGDSASNDCRQTIFISNRYSALEGNLELDFEDTFAFRACK